MWDEIQLIQQECSPLLLPSQRRCLYQGVFIKITYINLSSLLFSINGTIPNPTIKDISLFLSFPSVLFFFFFLTGNLNECKRKTPISVSETFCLGVPSVVVQQKKIAAQFPRIFVKMRLLSRLRKNLPD